MSESVNTNSEQQKVPTKEEFITHLKEQIEIAEVRLVLQDLNARIAKSRADEVNALAFIARTFKEDPASRPATGVHVVTQEDLDTYPELMEAGVKVGQEIAIPMENDERIEVPAEKLKERKLKKV